MVTVPLAVMAAAGLMPQGRRATGDFLFLSTGGRVGVPLLHAPDHQFPAALLQHHTSQHPALCASFFPLRAVGTYSLFPLLFEPEEYPIKVNGGLWPTLWPHQPLPAALLHHLPVLVARHCRRRMLQSRAHAHAASSRLRLALPPLQVLLLVTFNLIAAAWLPQLPLGPADAGGGSKGRKRGDGGSAGGAGKGGPLLTAHERLYLWGLVAVELATSWLLPPLLGERLPFLPLMSVSLYCSLGMLHAWRRLAQLTW